MKHVTTNLPVTITMPPSISRASWRADILKDSPETPVAFLEISWRLREAILEKLADNENFRRAYAVMQLTGGHWQDFLIQWIPQFADVTVGDAPWIVGTLEDVLGMEVEIQ